jgi:DNA-binding transcriptional MerR regulator
MFKIGDFSRLSRVSVRVLHHYDDIGLFKPLRVDQFTSYRYYSFEQLPRLNRILALKDLGFSLEQIGGMLDEELPAAQIRGMLRLRRAELQQQAEEIQERLARVEARLRQIEEEGKMPNQEVILKSVTPLKIVAAREVVPSPDQMRERCGALIKEVERLIEAQGIKGAGPSLALYYEDGTQGIDVEMACCVDAAITVTASEAQPNGQAVIRELPGVEQVASTIYHGSYDAFGEVGKVYAALNDWIAANGYRVVGPAREIYLQTPDWRNGKEPIGVMEIQFPVQKT